MGHIDNLEKRLDENWWKSIFNEIYLKTDGDIVENATSTKSDVDFLIKYLNPEPDSKILDVCCGQGRHSFEMFRRGFQPTCIDYSSYLLEVAAERNKEAKLTFLNGDVRNLTEYFPANSFDHAICMGNSFGYFYNQQDDLKVLTNIKKLLKSRGTLALDITNGNWTKANFLPTSWEWVHDKLIVNRQRQVSKDGCKLISREIVIDKDKGIIADQIYAERLYSETQLKNMLHNAGFSYIDIHPIETFSDRNQDLGMMANRLLYVGLAVD